ncbi:MAG TPA: glycosyltransferase family 9 protein [Longimicrobiales bacterium]
MRILLVQLGRLGDVLLATPAIRALREAYPAAGLEFLTRPAFAPVLDRNPALDRVRRYRARHTEAALAREAFGADRYDVVVDFQSTPHSALLARLTRAPVRIGRDKRLRLGYTHRLRLSGEHAYSAAHKIELLRPLGIGVGSLRLELPVADEDHAYAAALWDRLGWPPDAPAAALSPVSRRPYKRWPLDRFAAVGDALSRRFDGRLLITSGPGERGVARAVASMMREPAVWDYGATTLGQLAAVYARCALWVGNDNGPKHIAAAVGTPTVAIFRPGQAAAWTNPEAPAQVAVEPPPGAGERPLEAIPVERVLAAVDEALARAARA